MFDLDLEGPSNRLVPVKVTGAASKGFEVEYTPTESGKVLVIILAAGNYFFLLIYYFHIYYSTTVT